MRTFMRRLGIHIDGSFVASANSRKHPQMEAKLIVHPSKEDDKIYAREKNCRRKATAGSNKRLMQTIPAVQLRATDLISTSKAARFNSSDTNITPSTGHPVREEAPIAGYVSKLPATASSTAELAYAISKLGIASALLRILGLGCN